MIGYIDKHLIEFVDEWGDKVLPQLSNVKYNDLTDVYSRTKRCKLILDSLKEGRRIYTVGFKDCRGLIKKWLYDDRGRMIRDKGRGIIEINPSVIAMSVIDINVPFISSDEVLLVKWHRDKPYNLEKSLVEEAMIAEGLNPKKDIQFIFFIKPSETEITINRFVDDFKHIITREYRRAKGIVAIQDPKWIRYHGSDEVTRYTNAFFFSGVRLTYTKREAMRGGKQA